RVCVGYVFYLVKINRKVSVNNPWSVSVLKKVNHERAAQLRPAQRERKNRTFFRETTGVWFETRSASN
ncbi:MAG TPA: hypothetical protein H9857_10590, partial [Candidatus Desulfovibrio intestinigallinarum]|nr:hypothetical protein [Candidatus Desulfovibrio intestinigallinarum]